MNFPEKPTIPTNEATCFERILTSINKTNDETYDETYNAKEPLFAESDFITSLGYDM